ncbi:hypothetical protein [Maribellus maritimus]|uniref:hypothetical protein n=1 Tax=Maribellus maritimus TaxID=2870838 RepID=UPI001EE9D6EC|nr:hypothetical protein [Maribellus maritimus]MCG6186035.1 hypothetical protein [Maribellus maritimus]
MKIQFHKSANYIGWIVIILAFALLYFSYFFIYIPNQESKLQQRAFRILKEYGNNMFGKNDYYQNHFKNYGLYYKIRHYNNTNQMSRKSWLNTTNTPQLQDVQKVVDGLLPYVQLENEDKTPESIFIYLKKENKLFIDYGPQIPDTISKKSIDSVKDFYLPNYRVAYISNVETLLNNPVKYKVPVDILMQGLKFDRLFENIILFDDSLVYYNSKFDLVADITNPKALCDSIENVQGGIWETLNIRGEDKHVMILPIDFLGKRFCIAGLIVDEDFRDKTRTINSQILILIAAILLLIFIGMPILKIIFIDEKERLKAMDASGSAMSTIFGAGLLVLIVIGVIKHQFVDRSILKDRLKLVSDSLYSYVDSDINSIKSLYVSINDSTHEQSSLSGKVRDHFKKPDGKFYQLTRDTLDKPLPINEIILIQPNGIVNKAVTRTRFSEVVPLDLSARNYFTQAVDKANTWPSPSYNVNFYIESIKSYNTGKGETAFSFHNVKNDSLPVTAITSAVPSFYFQVLPKDIEYVIVNATGNVLYHSIKAKNLHENFFDECESNPKLLKAIDLRSEEIVHINYNEKKWIARVVPINESPLYHITLLDIGQTDNKNARIFLFTFYFLFVSLVFIGLGMLVMRWIIPPENTVQKPIWFLSWLHFQSKNYRQYFYLSLIIIALIIVQFSGILYIQKPFSVLVYQLIFVIYTSFVTLIFLNRKKLRLRSLFRKKYYPENIILLVTVIMSIILLFRFFPGWPIFIPLTILTVFTLNIPRILQFIDKQPKLTERYISRHNSRIRRNYIAFLFLWLTSISAVPVVQYYFSIKYQEEKYWKQDQLFSVAMDNLELKANYPDQKNTEWLKRIQGNGIDNLKVNFVDYSDIKKTDLLENSGNFNEADIIYNLLPDPVNEDYGIKKNPGDSVYTREWIANDTTLVYSKGGTDGAVQVVSNTTLNTNIAEWLLSIIITFSLVAIAVWILLQYIAGVLLNLNSEQWSESNISWWETLFENKAIRKILLHSFNGEYYLKKTKEYVNEPNRNNQTSIETISTLQLIDPEFECDVLVENTSLIWINGLDLSIYEIDKHKFLLIRLQEICRNTKGKVVVDIPFDLESIDEFYDDYVDENEIKQKDIRRIYLLKKRWKTTFKNFFEFNGYLNHKAADNQLEDVKQVSGNQRNRLEHKEWEIDDNETQFINIWDNLTGYEKIVLYDLADDGLLNRKNKAMIERLVNKKLIIPAPFPRLFSEDFRIFVNQSMEPSDVKAIEKKLGLKGKWRNIQYLILLILIPLAAFILISQGISIEKIFGIFAGVLTVITGVMRLFDSQMFRQSAS